LKIYKFNKKEKNKDDKDFQEELNAAARVPAPRTI